MPPHDQSSDSQPNQSTGMPQPTTLEELSINQTPTPPPLVKTRKPKTSIVGLILSVIAWILAEVGWGLVNAQFKPTGTSSSQTANQIATKASEATGHIVASLIGLPFLVIGFTLGIVAILLVLISLRNGIRTKNAIVSTIAIALSTWGFYLIIGAFAVLKAH